jgi:hypothetical protein
MEDSNTMSRSNAAIKALHTLTRDTVIPAKHFDRHVREIIGRNHRLIAIVCASIVEVNLARLIKTFLRDGEGDLFDNRAPFSAFAAKIEVSYRLGLIDADVRRNANYLREIRNLFAHRIAPTSFRTREVAAVCKLLAVNFPGFPEIIGARERYWRAALQTGKAINRRCAFGWEAQPASLQ